MTLTRGSRSDHIIPANARLRVPGMREWGRRNLSFSGDWVSKLRNRSGSRNASVAPAGQGRSREPSGGYLYFPSRDSCTFTFTDHGMTRVFRRETQIPVHRLRKSRTPPTFRTQTFRLQRTRLTQHHSPSLQPSTPALRSATHHQPPAKHPSRSRQSFFGFYVNCRSPSDNTFPSAYALAVCTSTYATASQRQRATSFA